MLGLEILLVVLLFQKLKEKNKQRQKDYETKLEELKNFKKRINRKILNIVPDFENNIRKYSSTSFVQEKKRGRRNGKKTSREHFKR